MIHLIEYHYTASGRKVVMVVHFIDSKNPIIAGDALSEGYSTLSLLRLYGIVF